MTRQAFPIPDHSPAALLNLAFKQSEEEDLEMLREEMRSAHAEPKRSEFARKIDRRLRRERAQSLLPHARPARTVASPWTNWRG